MTRSILAVALLATLGAPGGVAEVGSVEFAGTWKDPDNFSGAALVGNRVLVAIDEEGFLQTGLLDAATGRVTRDKDIELAAGALTAKIELDIEALAANGTTVYALGSHSATRQTADKLDREAGKNRKRLLDPVEAHGERDVLYRFTLDAGTGAISGLTKSSLRPMLKAFMTPFADHASKENGIDLEGLAVDGTTLFAGFRGPVLRHGFTPVLRFAFDTPSSAEWLFVPLDGRGIRDMAKVDGGFLILAGPVGDSDLAHRLYAWNGKDCIPGTGNAGGSLRFLGDVPAPTAASEADRRRAKSEAVLVLGETATGYDVMLLYDGLASGGATKFKVPKAAAGDTAATRLCGAAAP